MKKCRLLISGPLPVQAQQVPQNLLLHFLALRGFGFFGGELACAGGFEGFGPVGVPVAVRAASSLFRRRRARS